MTPQEIEVSKRRTFAIISHPDAGKTTLTEKLLLLGGAIQMAGPVKGRKADRMSTSDWMLLEQQRGISVTTSAMQFPYREQIINLLDTPGHADFSEDTYRTLTAVDTALMVIDAVKGVEERTIKLMDVCRLRDTPIITFINKLDRESREPIELLDEIERVLGIQCAPMTWPIGMGKGFKGVYHLLTDEVHLFHSGKGATIQEKTVLKGLDHPQLADLGPGIIESFKEELDLVQGASHRFDLEAFHQGKLTPVYFGSALNNFGIVQILDALVDYALPPQVRACSNESLRLRNKNFLGSCLKFKPTWIPIIVTEWPFYGFARDTIPKG